MKYLVLLFLVHHSYAYRTTVFSENKRQLPDNLDSACVQAYFSLSTDELKCLDTGDDDDDDYGSSDDILLTPSEVSDMCGNGFCMDVIRRLVKACKSSIQDALPNDYKDINANSFLNLLCAKDFSGIPCYNRLPLDANVLSTCQSVLQGRTCSSDCRNVLIRYNTTCCFATLLSMQPDTGSIQPSQLWSICEVSGNHTLCNVKTSSNSESDDNNNTMYIIAAAGGFFILLVIVIIIIVVVIAVKKCSKSRLSMNSGDVVRMSLSNNEYVDEDDDDN